MDGKEFDTLVRKLGGMASRRAAIAGMIAGAVGATRIGQAAAKRKGRGDVGTVACNDQGCLLGGIQCLSGFGVDGACGSGGNACIACAGATPRCAPSTDFTGGSCQAAITCGSSQCQLAGACVSLSDPRVCGRFPNGTCRQGCAANQVCNLGPIVAFPGNINGTCVANTCTATCTTGCCSGLTCNSGDSIGACGAGGVACVNCVDRCGLTDNGCGVDPEDGVRKCQCEFIEPPPPVEECGPANCPNGCCLNGQCQQGTAKESCGTGGGVCATCTGKKKCNAKSRTCKKRR